MSSYVGFANLPNQVHRKTVKRGFEFTLMVVGELVPLRFPYHKVLADFSLMLPNL